MQKTIVIPVALVGLALGGCGDLAGLSVGSTQPLRVSAVDPRAEPVIHYGGDHLDERSDFVDPMPRYLARTGMRQAAVSPPKSASAAAQPSQARTDPPTTGTAAPTTVTETGSLSAVELMEIGRRKHEEAMADMNKRIDERDRALKRAVSGICTGC